LIATIYTLMNKGVKHVI